MQNSDEVKTVFPSTNAENQNNDGPKKNSRGKVPIVRQSQNNNRLRLFRKRRK